MLNKLLKPPHLTLRVNSLLYVMRNSDIQGSYPTIIGCPGMIQVTATN